MHVSKGDGRERYIEVIKTNCRQPDDAACRTNSVTRNDLVSNIDVTEVSSSRNVNSNDVVLSQVENYISDVVGDAQMSSLSEHINGSCEAATSTDTADHVGADSLGETSSNLSELCCSNCGRQVPQVNYQLHLVRCRSSDAKSTDKKNKDKSSKKVTYILPPYDDISVNDCPHKQKDSKNHEIDDSCKQQ